MKYQPELFAPQPGAEPPTDPSNYLFYGDITLKEKAALPSKWTLIIGYFLIFCGFIVLSTGGFILYWPIGGWLIWRYYSRHASYREATDPISYVPRVTS